jgi:phosphatidylglycerol:prolipoprotein diacylglycerol transferase
VNGITIDVDPVLFHLGHFALRWFSLLVVLAVAGAWLLGMREARRKGLNVERLQGMLIWLLVGGIAGARLFHVIDRWELYGAEPLRALAVWEGGIAIWGAILGGLVAGTVYVVRHGLDLPQVLDAAAPAILLGQGLGRLACIPNGDAYGAPADLPWSFIYTNPASMVPADLLGVPLHPYPVYELLFDLGLLAVLWIVRTRPPFAATPGLLFVTYVATYSVGRFVLSYTRVEKVWFWGLQEAQVISLIALLVALAVLIAMWLRDQPSRPPPLQVDQGS